MRIDTISYMQKFRFPKKCLQCLFRNVKFLILNLLLPVLLSFLNLFDGTHMDVNLSRGLCYKKLITAVICSHLTVNMYLSYKNNYGRILRKNDYIYGEIVAVGFLYWLFLHSYGQMTIVMEKCLKHRPLGLCYKTDYGCNLQKSDRKYVCLCYENLLRLYSRITTVLTKKMFG